MRSTRIFVPKRLAKKLTLRAAFTAVELCIVMTIIGVLVSLLLPAVQSARESARSFTCSARIRDLAIGSIQIGDAHRTLPESRFVFDDQGRLIREQTWGRMLELTSRTSDTWCTIPDGFQSQYSNNFENTPAVRLCPSSLPPSRILGLTAWFNGPIDQRLSTQTSDYRGSLGIQDIFAGHKQGAFSIKKNGFPKEGFEAIEDGLSNTIFAWETVGAKFAYFREATGKIELTDWNKSMILGREQLFFKLGDEGSVNRTPGSTLDGYLLGWSGVASGAILVETFGSAVPGGNFLRRSLISNQLGDPFSMHPSGISVANADGSTASLNRRISLEVLTLRVGISDQGIAPVDD